MKKCSKCSKVKDLEFFYFDNQRDTYYSQCKVCHGLSGPDSRFSSAWWVERFSEEELNLFSKLKNLCTKAKLRNREFDLSVDWRYLFDLWESQNGLCALSGLPLSYETNHPHVVSLDRTDSSEGYIVGNLQLVSWTVNHMKQNLNEEFFVEMCSKITSYRNKTT